MKSDTCDSYLSLGERRRNEVPHTQTSRLQMMFLSIKTQASRTSTNRRTGQLWHGLAQKYDRSGMPFTHVRTHTLTHHAHMYSRYIVYVHRCTPIHSYTQVYTCVYTKTHTFGCTSTQTHVHIHTYTCTHVHDHTCTHTCIQIHMHTNT